MDGHKPEEVVLVQVTIAPFQHAVVRDNLLKCLVTHPTFEPPQWLHVVHGPFFNRFCGFDLGPALFSCIVPLTSHTLPFLQTSVLLPGSLLWKAENTDLLVYGFSFVGTVKQQMT